MVFFGCGFFVCVICLFKIFLFLVGRGCLVWGFVLVGLFICLVFSLLSHF